MNLKLSTFVACLIAISAMPAAHAQAAKKPAPTAAKPAADVAVTVNGTPLSNAMAQSLLQQVSANNPDIQQTPPDQLRKEIREELVKRELLAQEARKAGLDKDAQFVGRLDVARQTLLMGAYLDTFIQKNPVSDAAIRTEYDRLIALSTNTKEYKLRHIQAESEAEAQALIKKLDSGAKFEEVVKESKDIGSRDNGGDLGWMNPNPAFTAALSKLAKGAYTKEPVKTEYGYHVIMFDDERKPDAPEFSTVKDRVRDNLIQQMIQRHVGELLKSAKVN